MATGQHTELEPFEAETIAAAALLARLPSGQAAMRTVNAPKPPRRPAVTEPEDVAPDVPTATEEDGPSDADTKTAPVVEPAEVVSSGHDDSSVRDRKPTLQTKERRPSASARAASTRRTEPASTKSAQSRPTSYTPPVDYHTRLKLLLMRERVSTGNSTLTMEAAINGAVESLPVAADEIVRRMYAANTNFGLRRGEPGWLHEGPRQSVFLSGAAKDRIDQVQLNALEAGIDVTVKDILTMVVAELIGEVAAVE